MWFAQGANIAKVTPRGAITSYHVSDGSMPYGITLGPDGNLWFVDQRKSRVSRITPSGTITQWPTPTPASAPNDIAVGPDGNLWFTESANAGGGPSQKVGRITTAGVITEFTMPTASERFGITAGPNTTVWVTEFTTSNIGRIQL
jgi:virginiamycin B lyase